MRQQSLWYWRKLGDAAVVVAALAFVAPEAANAQATLDNGTATAAQFAARLQGSGVTISNAAYPPANGSDEARMFGLFSNGVAGAALEINTGSALSTGRNEEMFTSNDQPDNSRGPTTTYNDPDLIAIEPGAIYNVAVITMDVTLDAYATGLTMRYQFGSEEYPDYVGSAYNDLMAILISGPGITGKQNIAAAPSGGATDINTVNFGVRGCASSGASVVLTNNASYTRNGHTTALPGTCNPASQPGPFPVVMEWNGLTKALTAQASNLTPGGVYHLKLAVADVGDWEYDSGVIFEAITATYGSDFGDAPASYGAPSHVVRSALRLGADITRESAGYNDPNAAADAKDDGVTLPTLTRGQSATIPVSVAGTGGRLQAFLDWNGDGDFADSGEQIATNAQDGGAGDADGVVNGVISVSVATPIFVTLSQTFARFRWSSTTGLSASDAANDGEVEDYALIIAPGDTTLSTNKTVALYAPTASAPFLIPGNEVVYSIAVANAGSLPVDADSIFVVDALPAQVAFYNGATPEFGGAVAGFSQTGSSLTFTPSTDLRYSNLSTPPTSFAACSYSPAAGYDAAVTYVCFNPKGQLPAGDPDPSFTLSFRARIK